jgi:hypothetical protein
VRDFLLTFPIFIEPLDFLQNLMKRFDTYQSNIFGNDTQYVYNLSAFLTTSSVGPR